MAKDKDPRVLARAVELVAAGELSGDDIVRTLADQFDISHRTGRRYRDLARGLGRSDGSAVMTRGQDALPAPPPRPQSVQGETLLEFRQRWVRKLESWVERCEQDLEEGIVIGYREVGGTRDVPGELVKIHLNRPAAYRAMVKVVERIHKLVGADAPQQIQVTGAVAHAHADLGRDPLSMSPAERKREIAELRRRKEELASGSVLEVESET